MAELTQKELEEFLQKITGNKDVFALYQKVGVYGSRDHLFSLLKSRLEYCLDYLKTDFATLFKRMMAYQKKNPKKEFGEINGELYQDEMHPVVMMLFYAISEPFLLRQLVKQELLYLAFKLQKIKKIFIAGVGCGDFYDNIANVPLIKDPGAISVKGLDISVPGVEFCKKRGSLYDFKVSSEVGDLDYYDFAEKYDLIELSEVVEHVREPQKLLNNVASASKLILATIPLMLDVADHLHVFNVNKVREMLKSAGFDVLYETVRNSFYIKQYFYFAVMKGKV